MNKTSFFSFVGWTKHCNIFCSSWKISSHKVSAVTLAFVNINAIFDTSLVTLWARALIKTFSVRASRQRRTVVRFVLAFIQINTIPSISTVMAQTLVQLNCTQNLRENFTGRRLPWSRYDGDNFFLRFLTVMKSKCWRRLYGDLKLLSLEMFQEELKVKTLFFFVSAHRLRSWSTKNHLASQSENDFDQIIKVPAKYRSKTNLLGF